jgi:putrescine aminotransferase
MGAVLMADHVYQAIADSAPEAADRTRLHLFGPPGKRGGRAGSAAALPRRRLLENGVKTGKRFAAHLERIKAHPLVGDVRSRGMLGAIELVSTRPPRPVFDPALDIGGRLSRLTWDNGVIVRCFAQRGDRLCPGTVLYAKPNGR